MHLASSSFRLFMYAAFFFFLVFVLATLYPLRPSFGVIAECINQEVPGTYKPTHPFPSENSGPPVFKARFQHLRELQDLGPKGDRIWNTRVLPPGGGMFWVKVQDANPTTSTEEVEGWGITMFHALHCLQMIRDVFKALEYQEEICASVGPQPRDNAPENNQRHHNHDVQHATHCISYLYQVCSLPSPLSIHPISTILIGLELIMPTMER